MDYPAREEGVTDLGGRVFVRGPGHDGTYLWWHDCPKTSSWNWFGGEKGSGHRITQTEPLTVEGSLLCPQGCGRHGFIREGRWVPA